MDLLEIYFENFAWRGLRLQGKLVNRKKSQPHEFSISWHYSGNCWEVIEYFHKDFGPTKGKHYYLRTWQEVILHFKEYINNLGKFSKDATDWESKIIADKI